MFQNERGPHSPAKRLAVMLYGCAQLLDSPQDFWNEPYLMSRGQSEHNLSVGCDAGKTMIFLAPSSCRWGREGQQTASGLAHRGAGVHFQLGQVPLCLSVYLCGSYILSEHLEGSMWESCVYGLLFYDLVLSRENSEQNFVSKQLPSN